MKRSVVIKRLGYKASAALDNLRYIARRLFSVSGSRSLRHERLLRKCPTSFHLVEGLVSRPQPEASTSWKLVGHCAARFSFFQGAGHEGLLINHHDAGDLIASG